MIMTGRWNFAQKWWGDLMKTTYITFLTGLYFQIERHSNYMNQLTQL